MDQSASVAVITRSYGGSDSTKPSFNRPEFVRFGSRQNARDLGAHVGLDVRIEGPIGGECGSQALFFKFSTTQPCRIGARLLHGDRYTNQYISISLRDSADNPLPLGVDGFVGSSTYELQGARADSLELLEAGYVLRDYWQAGYAVYDYTYIPRLQPGDDDGNGVFTSAYASQMPPSTYLLIVSSSQWAHVPFTVQLVAIPNVTLAGSATLTLEPQGRLTLRKLEGVASLELTPEATLGSSKTIPIDPSQSAVADLGLEPRGTLRRRSPFE